MNTVDERRPPVQQSASRMIVFKTVSFLLPVLVLCLIEVGLRVFKYGYDVRLFIEYPEDKGYYVLNPDAAKRYFTNQKIATTGNIEPFKKKKDANTLRIFVLGESTTIGYPYFHNGSFHRWLQYRLTHTFPDRTFDIINLSLTAVNSYTIRGFADEVVAYEPDAVLIYTGHNEYYGALGVGSTERIGGNAQLVDLVLYLRQFRLMQLMTNAYEKLQNGLAGQKATTGGTRMKLMVADQQISYGSELYERGLEQFRRNLDKTLQELSAHNIPVFVSNLVSNEKDLKPFVSFPADNAHSALFRQAFSLGVAAFTQKKFPLAAAHFKAADKQFSNHALCNFYLGKTAYLLGDFSAAKRYFTRAKDLDGLRFRAPDALNTSIQQLCLKYPNTYLVDTKNEFETYSPNQIIGEELILEHVHPNLRGYAILSDAFYKALKRGKLITIDSTKEMGFAQLLRDMPITEMDSLSGAYKVARLKQSWPFKEVMTIAPIIVESVEEKIAYDVTTQRVSWLDALSTLYDYYIRSRQVSQARKVVETLVLEYPSDARYYEKAALLSGELKDDTKTIFYFKKAFALTPSFDKARYLSVLYLRLDRPQEALPYLDYAIQHNTSQFNLQSVKAYTEQVIGLQRAYRLDSTNVSILNQIAGAYYRMDNRDGARTYLQKVLTVDANNQEALFLLARIR